MKMMRLLTIIIALLGVTALGASPAGAQLLPTTATVEFFLRSDLNPVVGLGCQSEAECRTLCRSEESCVKPITPCLNCVGARSPEILDFFQNVGEGVLSCPDHGLTTELVTTLFRAVDLIPIWGASSAYNPLGLNDPALAARFQSLCPAGIEPVVIAAVDRHTQSLIDTSLVKCGTAVLPLRRFSEDCAEKTERLTRALLEAGDGENQVQAAYDQLRARQNHLALTYDTVRYSDYVETQYIRCTDESRAACQKLCGSELSCTFTLDNERTARAISKFTKSRWQACRRELFSLDQLATYLKSVDGFAFTESSLSQRYEVSPERGGFTNFSVLNKLLSDFRGVFQSAPQGDFFISTSYRDLIARELSSLCAGARAVVLGRGETIERVYCAEGEGGYFQALSRAGESCPDAKAGAP